MTRTHLYVAVICLGAGLFAGVGLRRDPESEQEKPKENSKGTMILIQTDPALEIPASFRCTGEGDARKWVYVFKNPDTAREAVRGSLEGIRPYVIKEICPIIEEIHPK